MRHAAAVRESGFEPLSITVEHAKRVAALPPHHADPFDRLLVAQADAEGLTLVSRDRGLAPRETPLLWT